MPRSVDPEILIAFGTALRDCRKAAGLSQEGLVSAASKKGLEAPNRSYVSSLERGRQEPGLGMQFTLARAMGMRPGEVLRKAEQQVLPRSELRRADQISAARIPLGTETCPGCRTVYSKYVEQLKSRQRGKFKCPRCKQPLASWLGTARFIFETSRRPRTRQAR